VAAIVRAATAARVAISTGPVSEAATGGKDKGGASTRFVPLLSTSIASHRFVSLATFSG
jgi:hypothetical protein